MNETGLYLVFGLTADPPHKGHEQVIINSYQFMKDSGLKVEQFDLIPTFHPNLIANKKQPIASYEQRMTMCQIMADDLNQTSQFNVQVNELERFLAFATKQKSFSYETLKAIKHPNKLFVLSSDHFAGRWPKFRQWHEWENLVKENGLLIHQRPGHKVNHNFILALKKINPNVFVANNLPAIKVSSTEIRLAFKTSNKNIDALLHPEVLAYAKAENIYS